MADRMFMVIDDTQLTDHPKQYSLPGWGQPGQWMSANGPDFELTSHPAQERPWNHDVRRIFVAESGPVTNTAETARRNTTVRYHRTKSVRLLEEVTPDWLHLDEHPDIRATLVSEFRNAKGDSLPLPEWASLRNLNLSGQNLNYHQLAGADFRGSDLTYAELSFTKLNYADFRGCDLRESKLDRLDAEGAEFSGADLTEANLMGGEFQSAHFTGARMQRVKCSSAILSGADLRNCDLRDADFDQAQLLHTFLAGADLNGATFVGARLSHIDLRDVSITRHQLLQCHWLEGIELRGAIVDGKRLDVAAAASVLADLRSEKPDAFWQEGVA